MKTKSIFKVTFILALGCLFLQGVNLFADETEVVVGDEVVEQKKSNFTFNYRLGTDYVFAPDIPIYRTMPRYQYLTKDIPIVDLIGHKGHLFHITNEFEFRRDQLSLTLFANATINYLPFYFGSMFTLVDPLWQASMACFKAGLDILDPENPWLPLNILLVFIPTLTCWSIGSICIFAIPVSVAILTVPMGQFAVAFDFHPYSNNVIDTKIGLGIDIDGYRTVTHVGPLGVYTEAQGSVNYAAFRFYAGIGYRLDILNLIETMKYNTDVLAGTSKPDDLCQYVPAPYVKAGISFNIK